MSLAEASQNVGLSNVHMLESFDTLKSTLFEELSKLVRVFVFFP